MKAETQSLRAEKRPSKWSNLASFLLSPTQSNTDVVQNDNGSVQNISLVFSCGGEPAPVCPTIFFIKGHCGKYDAF